MRSARDADGVIAMPDWGRAGTTAVSSSLDISVAIFIRLRSSCRVRACWEAGVRIRVKGSVRLAMGDYDWVACTFEFIELQAEGRCHYGK